MWDTREYSAEEVYTVGDSGGACIVERTGWRPVGLCTCGS